MRYTSHNIRYTLRRSSGLAYEKTHCECLQILPTIFGFSKIVRRFIGAETALNFLIMIIVPVFALAANTASIIILDKSRSTEGNITANQICTSTDIITNTGVIAAGVLALLLQSKIPDSAVGAAVFTLVLYSAFKILRPAK